MSGRLRFSCAAAWLGDLVFIYSFVVLRRSLYFCASSELFVVFSFWVWCFKARQENLYDPSGGVFAFPAGAYLPCQEASGRGGIFQGRRGTW